MAVAGKGGGREGRGKEKLLLPLLLGGQRERGAIRRRMTSRGSSGWWTTWKSEGDNDSVAYGVSLWGTSKKENDLNCSIERRVLR